VRIYGNIAKEEGGAIFSLSPLNFTQKNVTSASFISHNFAAQGGGICASGQDAILTIDYGYQLLLVENRAESDGGGLSLEDGAILRTAEKNCDSACPLDWRGNGMCNKECMSSECDWYGFLICCTEDHVSNFCCFLLFRDGGDCGFPGGYVCDQVPQEYRDNYCWNIALIFSANVAGRCELKLYIPLFCI
jgi:hypothetical protein